ncbi:MAG: hypothetical protein FWE56_05150, partial [Candidatus Bathyarchaeota archaeon]|nr:hypothetical protein [Candidatus Termiticorpusculum sp.]
MSDTETAILKQISTLTKTNDVKDQKILRKLLIEGKAYSPQEGYVIATTPIITEEAEENNENKNAQASTFNKEEGVWETRTPKPKHKGDIPSSYEFCSYTNYAMLSSDILRITREVSFTEWIEHDNYKYKRIAGGVMRRLIT